MGGTKTTRDHDPDLLGMGGKGKQQRDSKGEGLGKVGHGEDLRIVIVVSPPQARRRGEGSNSGLARQRCATRAATQLLGTDPGQQQ